jgi:hypothetical protein
VSFPLARAALVALALALAAGCGHLADNLRQREIVVRFVPGATPAQHREVRSACDHFTNARPEPLPTSTLRSVRLSDVRFRVDDADDAELARLESCLTRFRFVQGVDDTGDVMH